MAKLAREQAVRERRARKKEKKDDKKRAASALGAAAENESPADTPGDDTPSG